MKTLQRFLDRTWRPALVLITLALMAYLLYFHHLGSLLPGYTAAEQQTYAATQTWHGIVSNPVNAPYKVVLLALTMFSHHGLLLTRVTSALFGVLAVVIFFSIASAWYGFRVGFLSAVLFATSGGFLHFVRLGTPLVLQMGIIALIGLIIWHRKSPHLHPYLTYAVVITFSLLLYVPGMVWFEVLTLLLIYPRIMRHWSRSGIIHRILWPLLTIALVLPLAWSITKHANLLVSVLGVPSSLHAIPHIGVNLLHTVLAIGVRSDSNPLLWVGHSPLLNVTELILGALGIYYYAYRQRSSRSLLLIGIAIIGIVLSSLGGGISIACIIPVLYLLITSGLNHFVGQWLTVFPRNPIARGTGVTIVCIMLFFSVLYHVRSYFVAWPHTTATRQAFRLPRS